jgi:hypothetical protein
MAEELIRQVYSLNKINVLWPSGNIAQCRYLNFFLIRMAYKTGH